MIWVRFVKNIVSLAGSLNSDGALCRSVEAASTVDAVEKDFTAYFPAL